MLDLAALPIAFALTLWDAVPVYLPVGVAIALLLRVLAPPVRFQQYWNLRGALGLEGMVFAVLLYPSLVPVLVAGALSASAVSLRSSRAGDPAPETPGHVIRQRAEELLGGVMLAGALAALVKVGATALSAPRPVEALAALVTGAICGFRSGAVAVPAVAIAVHLGGLIPAGICIAASVAAAPVYHRVTGRERGGDVVRSTPD